MRTAERALLVRSGILLVAAIGLCWCNAASPYSYSRGNSADRVPWPVIWAQFASSAASAFALVGLATAADLLFLRAVRWTDRPADDKELTPESSP